MNDNELSTMVRESVADVHATTSIAQIVSRGRAVRARRRTTAAAGAAAVVTGTALAVTSLLPSGHPGSGPASARLDAWTVAKQANGDIDVTIHQLRNPAGLQRTLRADGLPVNVTFSGHSPSASCQLYPMGVDSLSAIVHYGTAGSSSPPLVIDPTALPAGAGLAIFDGVGDTIATPPSASPGTAGGSGMGEFNVSHGHLRMVLGLEISPVQASQQCTG